MKDIELCEKCYRFEEQYNWLNPNCISQKYWPVDIMKDYNIKINDVYNNAYLYLENLLGKEKAKNHVVKKSNLTENALFMTKNAILTRILATDDPVEQEELIINGKITTSYFFSYSLSIDDKTKAEESVLRLREIMDNCREIKKQRRAEELQKNKDNNNEKISKRKAERIKAVNTIVDMILESDCYDLTDFAIKYGFKFETIENAMDILKISNAEKFKTLKKVLDNRFLGVNPNIEKDLPKIIKLIKNGIVLENGETRPFDVIDYFENYEYSFKTLKRANKLLISPRYTAIINHFVDRNNYPVAVREQEINNIVYEINYIYKGRSLTTEEKQKMHEYIINNNIPLNSLTFTVLMRHYFDGQTDLDNTKRKLTND